MGAGGAAPILRAATGWRILLAEANVVNRVVAAAILEKCGHSLAHAPNGRQAVEAAGREAFDLIFMDVQMSEMDGFEATRRIRKSEQATGRHATIVTMTAHAIAGDRECFLTVGMGTTFAAVGQGRAAQAAQSDLRQSETRLCHFFADRAQRRLFRERNLQGAPEVPKMKPSSTTLKSEEVGGQVGRIGARAISTKPCISICEHGFYLRSEYHSRINLVFRQAHQYGATTTTGPGYQ
jgi:CheY-like chemotaxis protein